MVARTLFFVCLACLLFHACGDPGRQAAVAAPGTANGAGMRKEMLESIKKGDHSVCEALSGHVHASVFSPQGCERLTPVDQTLLIDVVLHSSGSLRMGAIKLLGYYGGYEADMALLGVVRSGDDGDAAAAAEALKFYYGDPRIGPVLLERFNHYVSQGRYTDAAFISGCMEYLGYGTADPTIGLAIGALTRDEWWIDDEKRRTVDLLISSLVGATGSDASSTYNRVLLDVSPLLASASGEPRFPGELFRHAPRLADGATLDLFAGYLEEPDSQLVADHVYQDMCILAPAGRSLHANIRAMLDEMLPWTKGWLDDRRIAYVRGIKDLDDIYMKRLKISASLDETMWLMRRLSFRRAPAAGVAIEETIARHGESIPSVWRANLWLLAARCGSERGIKVVYETGRIGGSLEGWACQELRRLTGVNFGNDMEQWGLWLKRASTDLRWEVGPGTWQPTDRWEDIARELSNLRK